MIRYFIKIMLILSFVRFTFAQELISSVLYDVDGLPDDFKVYTSLYKNEEIRLDIKNLNQKKESSINMNAVVFKIEKVTFLKIGKNKRPFLVVEWLKAPHGGWAFIYDLEKLEKGHLDVIKSYYPFEEVKGDLETDNIYLFGTSYKSMSKKDPVIKFTWKVK